MTSINSYTTFYSPPIIEELKEETNKLQESDFIYKSNSLYAEPTLCVQKKDRAMRFCVEYQIVNRPIKMPNLYIE